MQSFFICFGCGSIIAESENIMNKILKREHKCNCGDFISMENSYPPLSSQDFVFSAQELFEKAKECDKENLNQLFQFLPEAMRTTLDKTILDSYLNTYEKIREKYPDNNRDYFLKIGDEFEDFLSGQLSLEQSDTILSCIRGFNKNKFRKPFVIMVASLIEQLFNRYFEVLVNSKLTSNVENSGANLFLEKYSKAGIQKCIDISDSFLDESLRLKMEKYKQGFYDEWTTLRNLRNGIIHRNSDYISKIKVSKVLKIVNDSLVVFSKLEGELYNSDRVR